MKDITEELFTIMKQKNCSPILALITIKENEYEYVRKYDESYDAESYDTSNADK